MKTISELIIKAWILCQIASMLENQNKFYPTISTDSINEEIDLIILEIRELAKMTRTQCIL